MSLIAKPLIDHLADCLEELYQDRKGLIDSCSLEQVRQHWEYERTQGNEAAPMMIRAMDVLATYREEKARQEADERRKAEALGKVILEFIREHGD